jgi:hypothetical protein
MKYLHLDKFRALSPDGFDIDMHTDYKTREDAQEAIRAFAQRFAHQGYYSTIRGNQSVQIPINEIADYCRIVGIPKVLTIEVTNEAKDDLWQF